MKRKRQSLINSSIKKLPETNIEDDQIDPTWLEDLDLDSAFFSKIVKKSKKAIVHQSDDDEIEKSHSVVLPSNKLPVFDANGLLVTNTNLLPSQELAIAKAKQTEKQKLMQESEESIQLPQTTNPKKKREKEEDIDALSCIQVQERFAELADLLISGPEENIASLNTLFTLTKNSTIDENTKVGISTLLAVFLDILPDYRIQTHDLEGTLSTKVKTTREYESCLLKNYQGFLILLESYLPKFRMLVSKILSALIIRKPRFNFFRNVLASVVNIAASGKEGAEYCCMALQKFFRADFLGDVSLEGVKLISGRAKAGGLHIYPGLVDCLIHLNVSAEEKKTAFTKEKKNRKSGVHISKSGRKFQKKDQELEKELKEAEAVVSNEDRMKYNSEVIKFIFTIYLRIFRNLMDALDNEKKTPVPLILSTLRGITHFALHINIDMLPDLLSRLKRLMADPRSNSRTRLQCAVASLKIVTGQGEAVTMDIKEAYSTLYTCILDLFEFPDEDLSDKREEIELVVTSLDIMFCQKKQIPITRAASFIKRLLTVSLQLPTNLSLACLSFCRILLLKQPRLHQLLDPEDRLGSGMYDPFLEESDLCNPFATNLWELNLMMNHYNPNVRTMSEYISSLHKPRTSENGAYQLITKSPAHFLKSVKGGFKLDPALKMPRKPDLKGKKPRGPSVVHNVTLVPKSVENGKSLFAVKEREAELRRMVEVSKDIFMDLLDEDVEEFDEF